MGFSTNTTNDIHDVIIIGAGVAGITAAYRFQTAFPNLNYTVLERRSTVGGTWDIFRYPGIRSDSDLYTYAFPWRPWPYDKTIVAGDLIQKYIVDATEETGVDQHIRFQHEVTRASWSTEAQMWTLSCLVNGGSDETTLHTRFVFWASGFFNLKEPLVSPISGIENFKGTIVHPQFWPEDLDFAGKNVVVIGSGATAVTLLPSLAAKAKKVTMVQRTPSYILSFPAIDRLGVFLRPWLPTAMYNFLIRLKFLLLVPLLFAWSRLFPQRTRTALKKHTASQLPPGFPIEKHFNPPYNPWDQRLCLTPEGDFYQAIREGKADVATGVIETCTPSGLRLASGQTIDNVDIIATATGFALQTGGGAQILVDGKVITPGEHFLWRGVMLQDVPNTALAFGYAPYSWTLGADTSAQLFARVMKDVLVGRYSSVVPRAEGKYAGMKASPMFPTRSTYVRLTGHNLPKVGDMGPWLPRTAHLHELWKLAFSGHTDGLVFSRG